MLVFKGLQPSLVWEYFEEICKVPHPSKNEGKIINYLMDFATKHGIEAERNAIGNVIMRKPATPGFENRVAVILQSHMDMVCEKNSDTVFDFNNDPIQPFIDNNWVKAKGTTLGADDGIGIAAQLAVLTDKTIQHGPVECLFTVDEETGLSGAFALNEGFMSGKILLNLDSEDEGELFIGCAGGTDTAAEFDFEKEEVPENHKAIIIKVSGLKGGHSGDDIHKGLGNSNKILNRFIWENEEDLELRLNTFDGGNLQNAIAREAYALVVLPKSKVDKVKNRFNIFSKLIKAEFNVTEPNLKLELKETDLPGFVIDENTQHNLLNAIYACPHGVHSWSRKMENMVETSTNLAAVKFIDDKKILVTTSQRSSVESAKWDIAQMVESVFVLAGANVEHSEGYPGWAPNPDSEIVRITVESYKRLFNKQPVVRAIHAGLECGLFLEKYPYLDMISFGPTIKGAHSPDERIDIETTRKFWELLIDVLIKIPYQK
ncbi:MAG: aminoacyl-histidine dipeptidase [Bacteroidota bacterium]